MTELGSYMDDAPLVARAKAGDFAAFDELVNRHEGRLYNLAMYILRNAADAEDIVQTTFLKAMEKLDTFREEASFGTWIMRIATNAALKLIRRRKTHGEISLDAATEPDDDGCIAHPEYIADWRDEPARDLARRELRDLLDQAIGELGDKYRLVFVLRDVEGLSIRDTAAALDLGESAVKVRLLRARLQLREKLTRRFGDPATRVDPGGHHDHVAIAAEILQSYQDERAAP